MKFPPKKEFQTPEMKYLSDDSIANDRYLISIPYCTESVSND